MGVCHFEKIAKGGWIDNVFWMVPVDLDNYNW